MLAGLSTGGLIWSFSEATMVVMFLVALCVAVTFGTWFFWVYRSAQRRHELVRLAALAMTCFFGGMTIQIALKQVITEMPPLMFGSSVDFYLVSSVEPMLRLLLSVGIVALTATGATIASIYTSVLRVEVHSPDCRRVSLSTILQVLGSRDRWSRHRSDNPLDGYAEASTSRSLQGIAIVGILVTLECVSSGHLIVQRRCTGEQGQESPGR